MHPLARALLAATLVLSACKGSAPAPGEAATASGLSGDWQRTLLTFDHNANDALDPEERKPASLTYGYTALGFDSDSKCRMEKGDKKFTGTCAVGTRDGKKWIELNPDGDLSSRYLIVSESAAELVLKDGRGNKGTIYVYARR